ncbi:RecQ family ATP-dependent DNA helicase [Amphibacillus sediminis]|uniref:RecQ family ATP-dependent DNA helicase n=1 Tax=Amphibacillus sediminis TaxID=360185 RepID=UPI00082ACFA6|nr:RecQ family ATP-dependent DNA helicase [Amphibacillus sediminis]
MQQLEDILHLYFNHKTFRLGQKEIINDIIEGKSVLATLPTGAGKSLCYQLPALITQGTVIVVSPLLSLMEDQVKQLKRQGHHIAVAINSFNTEQERQMILSRLSQYKLIYLSPEMLQNQVILDKLQKLQIDLFVIDEAHCISQWGHEFRPDYLKLNQIIEHFNKPTTLALTATATPDVQQDIINQLPAVKFSKHIYPMDRSNIAFIVEHLADPNQKDRYLIDLFEKFQLPSLIYFSSKKEAQRVAIMLHKQFLHLNVAYYHGDLDSTERQLIQQQFMEDQLDIVCCTSAFGMGVDKPNIRLIIHYHLPTQIESFIQEIGRAGRDQLSSVSITLATPYEHRLPERLIDSELPKEAVVDRMFSYLSSLDLSIQPLPIKDEDWMIQLQVTETQWRFLKNYLINKQIIEHNQFVEHKNLFHVKKELIKKIKQRNRYKMKKLDELVRWLNTDHCRRDQLYQSFSTPVSKLESLCCDQCGFSIDQWIPPSEANMAGNKLAKESWKDDLKELILPFKYRQLE